MNNEPATESNPARQMSHHTIPMSPRQYAEHRGVHVTTVHKWVREGMTLPGVSHLERTSPPEVKVRPRYKIHVHTEDT